MNIENIHIGDHVVVVSNRFDSYDAERRELYGGPAEVVGLCAPYIAVRAAIDPGNVKTVDTRQWVVTKCDRSYVDAFAGTTGAVMQSPSVQVSQTPQVVHCNCPVCREGRFIRVYEKQNEPYWRCSVCRCVIVEEACQP